MPSSSWLGKVVGVGCCCWCCLRAAPTWGKPYLFFNYRGSITMKMKNLLLLLSALIFAAPAWAAEPTGAPTNTPAAASSAPAAQPAKETPKKAKKKKKKKMAKSAATKSVTTACTKTCVIMNCPPPNGASQLCCPVAPYTQTCP